MPLANRSGPGPRSARDTNAIMTGLPAAPNRLHTQTTRSVGAFVQDAVQNLKGSRGPHAAIPGTAASAGAILIGFYLVGHRPMATVLAGAGLVGLALIVMVVEMLLEHRREMLKIESAAQRHRTPAVLGEAVAANRITPQDARSVISALSQNEAIAAGLANAADLGGVAEVIRAIGHPGGLMPPAP
jgi:hypothetical protein